MPYKFHDKEATVKIRLNPGRYVRLERVDKDGKSRSSHHYPDRTTLWNPTTGKPTRGWDYDAHEADVWVSQDVANELLGLDNPTVEENPQHAKRIAAEARNVPIARLLGQRTKEQAEQGIDPLKDKKQTKKKTRKKREVGS